MEKRALGKGLEALFRSHPMEEASADATVLHVPVGAIQANPFQPRSEMDTDRLAELADSIRIHGVLQPLVVRRHEHGYQLVAGERRFRAARAAGLDQVPVLVRDCTNRDMLELALIENLQREDINPVDAALAYRRLIDEFGLTQEEVAARAGKSRSSVANTLRLLNLPPDLRNKVAAGEISEGHARAILSLEDSPSAQRALAERIVRDHLSVRDAERLARGPAESRLKPTPAPPPRDPHVARVEEQLQRYFGTRVTLVRNGASGAIRIEFYDQEQLERILELLTGA